MPKSEVCSAVLTCLPPPRSNPTPPAAHLPQALSEVLEESEHRGTITPAQHHALMSELSSRLQPLLLHPA